MIKCGPNVEGCEQPDYFKATNDGFVKLWTTTKRDVSQFERSTQSPACVATKSELDQGARYWWIDCGLFHGKELPVIEGWVPEGNLRFLP